MTTDTTSTEYLGIRAAAKALRCNPSTVSRYLKLHPTLNRGTGKRPLVDVEEFREHHAANTNRAKLGSHAGRLFDEDSKDSEGDPANAVRKKISYSDAKATREAIAAQSARIDLDQKLGRLVPRDEVETAAYEVGQKLQRDLLGLGPQLAERLAAMADPREIAALIEAEHRRILASLAAAFKTEEPISHAA